MNIFVNDLETTVPDNCTLHELLELLEEPISHVVVEVNGTFVYSLNYGFYNLHPGDHVEIIHPAFGG